MLQSIRNNAQGWVAKALIGFIAFTFALFGLEHLGGLFGHSNDVATVNGQEISKQQLASAVDTQRRVLMSQMGEQFDPSMLNEQQLQQNVLQGMIGRMILLQAAKQDDLAYSDQAIDQQIISSEQFKENGHYSPSRFELWVRSLGMTPMQFRNYLREDRMLAQQQAAYMATDFVTKTELDQIVALQQQERSLRYASLSLDKAKQNVKVSDDQISAYYDSHKAQFMSPDEVQVQYVELDKSALAKTIKVSAQDLQDRYNDFVQDMHDSAASQREVAHILIKGTDEASLKQAEALYKQLEEGASFAQLAEQHSADKLTANKGGKIGKFEPGIFGDTFDKAVASLKAGEISKPVKTQYGYELIKVEPAEKTEVPAFEQVKAKLEQDVREAKISPEFVDKSRQLADIAYESADLKDPAEQLGLKIQETGYFSREGLAKGIAANPKVVTAAFSDDVLQGGNNSSVIELSPDKVLVLRVKNHKKPALKPIKEVSSAIEATLADEAAVKALREESKQILAQLNEGKSLSEVAKAHDLEWESADNITRQDQKLPQQLLVQAFKLPHPEQVSASYGSTELANGNLAIVALTGVKEGQAKGDDAKFETMKRVISMQYGNTMYREYRQWLEKSAEIKK